jgi:hypothetical protein
MSLLHFIISVENVVIQSAALFLTHLLQDLMSLQLLLCRDGVPHFKSVRSLCVCVCVCVCVCEVMCGLPSKHPYIMKHPSFPLRNYQLLIMHVFGEKVNYRQWPCTSEIEEAGFCFSASLCRHS